MRAAVGLTDGLGLDGDRCIRVIPRQMPDHQQEALGSKPSGGLLYLLEIVSEKRDQSVMVHFY